MLTVNIGDLTIVTPSSHLEPAEAPVFLSEEIFSYIHEVCLNMYLGTYGRSEFIQISIEKPDNSMDLGVFIILFTVSQSN